jgi:starch-binding outer membrane protein, SusD/RagB family
MTRSVLPAILLATLVSCKPGDILDVAPPTGVLPGSAQNSRAGAESILTSARAYVAQGFSQYLNGSVEWSGLLGDEFFWSYFTFAGEWAGIDARNTEAHGGFSEPEDGTVQALMAARTTLLTAIPLLEKYEPPAGQAKVALAFALTGYTELLVGEDFCAGMVLSTPTSSGVIYGTPLFTDSIFAVAESHFDSALKYAGTDSLALPLASVGLARARLNRANFAGAATAAQNVPTGFIYNTEEQLGGFNNEGLTSSNVYGFAVTGFKCGYFGTADAKGGNGMNYVSANDPRLVLDTMVVETCDKTHGLITADSIWYYPTKFGLQSTQVGLATGVEARLIEAEAALHAGQVGTWAGDLNDLRASAPSTYLALPTGMDPLTTDSTTGAAADLQVDVMFREKAFWLYGMGSRLGDMRRLVRQYGRDQSTVFPVGPYPFNGRTGLPGPVPTYGTEVNLTLPTPNGGLADPNPNYRGCLDRNA